MKIREAKKTDIDSLQRMNHGLYLFENSLGLLENSDEDWTFSRAGLNYFNSRIESAYCIALVGALEDEIIGFCLGIMEYIPTRTDSPIAEIENLFVLEKFRNKGYGKSLTKEFEKLAKKRGCSNVRVRSMSGNDIAVRFYSNTDYLIKEYIFEKKL